MQYNKPLLSISDQAQLLLDRGMQCQDRQRLEHYLAYIGYYRLSAYWLPYEQPSAVQGERNHQFQANTQFEEILRLYIFDRKLRLLVMEAIERIEVAVRSRWAGAMAVKYDSHAHMQSDLFKDPWNHAKHMAKLTRDLKESNETFVTHYKRKYCQPFLPPIWAVAETMSLGSLSLWVENSKDNKIKAEIAKAFGLPTVDILEKVLHALTPIRNICAHHSRLWNRNFVILLPHIKRLRDQLITEQRQTASGEIQTALTRTLYNFLVVIQHMMLHINPNTSWSNRLSELVMPLSEAQRQDMGFPADWQTRKPWVKDTA